MQRCERRLQQQAVDALRGEDGGHDRSGKQTHMPKMVALQGESASVWIHSQEGIVHHEFHKEAQGVVLRTALDTGVKLMEAYGATKWLSDDRKNGPLDTSDSDWARDDWFPRALAAGWKHWAVVLPELIIGKMNMQLFTTRYAMAGVTVIVFPDADDALQWLRHPTTVQPSAPASHRHG
jgi:hypothetical protein